MMDELMDVYNDNNEPTNIQLISAEIHQKGLWHRAAHVWLYNSQGEILLQLRNNQKIFYPNYWDISAAGQLDAGEEPIDCGLREAKEELGLKLKLDDLELITIRKHHTTFNNLINNEFDYVYIVKFDGDIGQLKIQKSELTDIAFFSTDKIEQELKITPEKYVPHGNYWREVIEEVRRRIGKN